MERKYIKEIAKKRGMLLSFLAENILGISGTHLSAIISGAPVSRPVAILIAQWCDRDDITVERIIEDGQN